MARIWNRHKQTNISLKKKVFVGLSGGVDSSVAAYLLKEATPNNFEKLFGRPTPKGFSGYDVVGIYINGYNVDGCAERDAEDARRAAEAIGIPFYVLDLREAYFEHVVEYMIDGYRKGLTPNPDVMCNKEIKFGLFLEKALALGADYVATGHYVRLRNTKTYETTKKEKELPITDYQLLTALDTNKDQSYFLWTLTQEQLKYCLFPIGGYTKPEVREIARKAGLPTAEKKDSQGICFLGQVKLPEFLKEYIEPKKGEIFDTEGNKVGEHEGVQFYTIGQRHLNVKFQSAIWRTNAKFQINPKIQNPKKKTDKEPYYVVSKDVKRNVLVVAEGSENPALFRKEIELTDVHFVSPATLSLIRANRRIRGEEKSIGVLARVRYRQPLVEARLVISKRESVTGNKKRSGVLITDYKLQFTLPIKFIAPGQSAVFYAKNGPSSAKAMEGREMLGGGVIKG